MRTVKSASTKVDYTKPVKIEDFELKDGDCFGRLFDITERLCLMCADRINCQNIYNTIELRERVSLKKKDSKFIDELHNKDDLLNYLKNDQNK